MRFLTTRVYVLLCMLAIKWQSWAQSLGDDDDLPVRKKGDDTTLGNLMDEEYHDMPIHFSFSDILMVVAILVVCYVFGKIWKGCTYLIIILVVVYYIMTH